MAVTHDGWKRLLSTSKKTGDLLATAANAQLIFHHDSGWKDVLAYDTFIGDIVTRKLPPWPKDLRPHDFKIGDFTEKDTWRAKIWIERQYGIDVKFTDIGGALQIASDRVATHPVRTWFESLKWDRKHRLDTWLTDIAGAEDTPYTRAVAKNFLISAAARIYKPGCQVDSMPIFEGPQGAGKTTMIKIIGGEWFLSTNIEIGDKDGYQVLKRKWIVEMGELDALSRGEISRVKQFVSQSVDTYRASYARLAKDHPRQSVFAGTINPEDGIGYLKDNTGARRFWPVVVAVLHEIYLEKLREVREQLIAEAVHRFKKGEAWHFTDAAVRAAAAAETEARREADPWEHSIGTWLYSNKRTRRAKEEGVTTHEVLTSCFDYESSSITRTDEMRAARAIRMNGWSVVTREQRGGLTARVYRPVKKLFLVESG